MYYFPATYSLLFALLITRLFPAPVGRFLVLIPLTAALSDLLENISIAYMAVTFDGKASAVAGVAQFFTRTKWIFVAASLGVLALGALRGVTSKG